MPSFKFEGQRIAYTEYGGGPAAVTAAGERGRTAQSAAASSRPVILLHGLLLSQEMHKPLAEALAARGNRAITLDLLGHGSSERPRDMWRYSMGIFAQQLIALLDHLKIEEAAVMGTSLGANTALRPIVHAINRQPIESTEEEQQYLVSIDCRAARASDIRSMLVQEFAAVPDVHFSEVDSTFVEDSGPVAVTAIVTSHKRRELALETIVARLSEADGIIRSSWREETHSS